MPQRIKTLLLEANGTHWTAVGAETLLRGVLRLRQELPDRYARVPWLRRAIGRRYETASYLDDWKDALLSSAELEVELCNVTDLIGYTAARRKLREYPLVIVLHSVAGDRMSLLTRTLSWFQQRKGLLAVFIGNEYDLMREKIHFLREAGVDYICSQLPPTAAGWLYDGCSGARVLHMPHALNPAVYRCYTRSPRPVDVAFIGDLYERLIGDTERTDIVRYFQRHAGELGLSCVVGAQRMRRSEWAAFLDQCTGVIGAESGTYYLDRDGRVLGCAKSYVARHPQASFEEVFAACFAEATGYVSGKAVSSRHFEPIGTRTCQILVEGGYNGALQAEQHYIAVKRDLSDVKEAVGRFRDVSYRSRIADTALEHALASHTYSHRVTTLVRAVSQSHGAEAKPQSAQEVS